MRPQVYRATLFALYQFSLLLGILMMPVALLARKLGLAVPMHRVISVLGSAYEDAADHGGASA